MNNELLYEMLLKQFLKTIKEKIIDDFVLNLNT